MPSFREPIIQAVTREIDAIHGSTTRLRRDAAKSPLRRNHGRKTRVYATQVQPALLCTETR